MPNFTDTKPMSLYEAAIGEKNQDYYIEKFEAFDENGAEFIASWNWAAFLAGGLWALYRKMYGWFFAWWLLATVAAVLHEVPSPPVQAWLALILCISWLAFSVFANSLYHAKIKARIDALAKSTSDASKLDKRLRAKNGVNAWVPVVFGALPVIGILAAVVLPAYQDKVKGQAVSKPSQIDEFLKDAPVALKPLKGMFDDLPAAPATSPTAPAKFGLAQSQTPQELLRSLGIGGNQDAGDVVTWGDAQLAARNITGENLALAHKFAIQWQYQFEKGIDEKPPRSLFLGYQVVLGDIDGNYGLCRPNPALVSAVVDRGDGKSNLYHTCKKL